MFTGRVVQDGALNRYANDDDVVVVGEEWRCAFFAVLQFTFHAHDETRWQYLRFTLQHTCLVLLPPRGLKEQKSVNLKTHIQTYI